MELHLGLALSSSSSTASSSSSPLFDLNCNTSYYHESAIAVHYSNKREHGDYDDDHTPQTAPLLVLNKNQLNGELQDHDCDGDEEVQSNSVFDHQRNNGDVTGWPPVKPCRKKLCHPKMGNEDDGVIGWPPVKLGKKKPCHPKVRNGGGGRSKSMYVKVHMEGVGIARKVDLNLHQSYQTLVPTLANMFGKRFEDVKLTYQDKEGDWLLAGDVPWGGGFMKKPYNYAKTTSNQSGRSSRRLDV